LRRFGQLWLENGCLYELCLHVGDLRRPVPARSLDLFLAWDFMGSNGILGQSQLMSGFSLCPNRQKSNEFPCASNKLCNPWESRAKYGKCADQRFIWGDAIPQQYCAVQVKYKHSTAYRRKIRAVLGSKKHEGHLTD